MKEKILCVDDDADIIEFYKDYLQRKFALDTALSGAEALELAERQGPYAVVIADMNMPEMNGIELLAGVQERFPDTVRIMLTADTERETAVEAINRGHIFRFLTKPCPPELLAFAIEDGIKQYRLITAERELLEKTLSGSIKMLTEILAAVAPTSFGQTEKVRTYARLLAQFMQLKEVWELEVAAMLCGIGYVTIPGPIIQKMQAGLSLSTVEKGLLTRVPEFGQKLLEHIPRLEGVARLVLYQNKNFDGTGFPYGELSGEDIPLGARILKVLRDLVQLESEGLHALHAVNRMKARAGAYDSRVLDQTAKWLASRTGGGHGRPVALYDLVVGQLLVSPIETHDGMLIVRAGNRISPMLLEKLNNFTELGGVKEPIFVED